MTDLISLLSKGLSRVFSTTFGKHQFFDTQPFLWPNSHIHTWLLAKTIALIMWIFYDKVMSLFFNMLSRFVIAFLQWNKHLLFSWLQLLFTLILETKKIMSVTVFTFASCIYHEVMGTDAMILPFWILSCKLVFSLSSFTSIKMLFIFFLFAFCHYGGVIWSWQMWSYWYPSQKYWYKLVSQSDHHFAWCMLHVS